MSANILSAEERQKLTTIPSEICDAELVRFFAATPDDLSAIDHRLRPAYRLDQLAHICILRWLGWSPSVMDRLPEPARVALCRQLGLGTLDATLQPPAARTSRLHAERARLHLGWQKYTTKLASALTKWLQPLAAEHDYAAALFEALCQHLYHGLQEPRPSVQLPVRRAGLAPVHLVMIRSAGPVKSDRCTRDCRFPPPQKPRHA